MMATCSRVVGVLDGKARESAIQNKFKLDALLCLDQSTMSDGSTPFHEAAKANNPAILSYLLRILKKRN